MIIKNKSKGIFFLIGILLFATFFVSADYSRSNPQFTQPGANSFNYNYGTPVDLSPKFDSSSCERGQDFIIQVAPFGCTPAVVRSDLLEEQNVPVFCQLAATQVNPLIKVDAINYISFKGKPPEGISGVGFHPAKAAIKNSRSTLLNSPILENIGYVVIVLNKQKNESAMPDFIEGTMTADIKYDIKNAFGIGNAKYYLPEINDEEWGNRFTQYGIWNGKGFLRAESIGGNSATITVYSDKENKISTVNLQKGKTSNKINLPGFYCLAGMQLRLDGLEDPDTRAKLNINGEIIEISEREKFLENKCTALDIEKKGLVQEIKIDCKEDQSRNIFDLRISPRMIISIDGEEKEVGIGDFLYETENKEKAVYVGYIGTKTNSEKIEDSYILLMVKPTKTNKLSPSELLEMKKYDDYTRNSDLGVGILDLGADLTKYTISGIASITKWLNQGKIFWKIIKENELNYGGKKIKIIDFADATDQTLEGSYKQNYDFAMEDYRTIIDSFPFTKEGDHLEGDTGQEIDSSLETFGEQALFNAIQLAKTTEQRKTMLDLCIKFEEKYPKSEKKILECNDPYKNSNSEIATQNVLINNLLRSISFEGIYEPSLEEFSAVVNVRYPDKKPRSFTLTKDNPLFFSNNTNEFIELKSLEQNEAILRIRLNPEGITETTRSFITSENKKLTKDTAESFGSGYIFTITEINLKKVAKVSVIPKIDNTGTQANFSFNIGIEKRAIQLAPDEIKSRIEKLNNTIEKWSKISEDLGETVKTFNAACLGTGILLTVKNFFENTGGKSIARQKVMRGEEGWTDICQDKVSKQEYSTINKCLLENSEKIDRDVDIRYKAMQDVKITDENADTEIPLIGSRIDDEVTDPRGFGEDISTQDIKTAFNAEEENRIIRYSQARDLQTIENALALNPSAELRKSLEIERYKLLSEINTNVEGLTIQQSFIENLNSQSALTGVGVGQYGIKDAINGVYDGGKTTQQFGDIESEKKVQAIVFSNKQYLIELEKTSSHEYRIVDVYDVNGNKLDINQDPNVGEIQTRFTSFREYDKSTYKNNFKNPELKYFETEPYKGMPALVPFDTQNGWYVAMKQTLPGFGNIQTYDDSGKIASFYVCNVGENQRAEFNSGIRDDICRGFNPGTGRIVGKFPGLTKSETDRLLREALSSVEEAQRQYKAGVSSVQINRERIKVGNPEVGVPEIQCQDFMSPEDCHLLFNVCDPVVCPTSRCNLGGTYHSSNVIQSGIIGSIALCLPNIKEDIFVPVCLTGIKAGIDNLLNVFKSYEDCLNTQLESGETIGICDEIQSIYLCEFFWREALPFSKMIIPKIFESLTGQSGSRGGGEYLGVQPAWQNAQDSIDYMSQYYGRDISNAFKLKIMEEVGGAVCKNFISAKYPASGEILDSLIEPASPPQYHSYFHEIPFTTATVPPTSQYKVYYYIYAGKESKAFYRVYLKSPEGSSLYQSSPIVDVASGFISKDTYASETKDFTAPTGYKELCINVNGQENCGFKQVSTSFALDYIEDKYLQEQAEQTDISTESGCISGSPSMYSFMQPNLQEGISEGINPALYDRGIIRICSTDNPGKGTDSNFNTANARWKSVGSCDQGRGDLQCWLDTKSVKDVVETTTIEEEILGDVTKDYVKNLMEEGNYTQNFAQEIEKIKELNSKDKTNYITNIFISKAFYNNQKAKLHLLRGNAYADLVLQIYKLKQKEIDEIPVIQCNEQYIGQCEVVKKIIEIVRDIKSKTKIDETAIKEDTGADCMEQLILQLTQQESRTSHCKNTLWDGESFVDDITCDSNENDVLRGDDGLSIGIMQINIKAQEINFNEVKNFQDNVRYGVNYLIKEYKKEEATLRCKEETKEYTGWEAALRRYNGLGCGGDENYVKNVLGREEFVKNNFRNVCGGELSSTTFKGTYIPIFEFEDGRAFITNLYYKFEGDVWKWSPDKTTWLDLEEERTGFGNSPLSEENKRFKKQLKEKENSYEQGLKLLLDRTIKNNEDGFMDADLTTEKVIFSPDSIFSVTQKNGELIYLKEGTSNWEYSLDKKNWSDVKTTTKGMSREGFNLIDSLDGKNFIGGAEIIFRIYAEISIPVLQEKDFPEIYEEETIETLQEDVDSDVLPIGIDEKEETKYDLNSAIEKSVILSGKYSKPENKKFIDEICSQELLTEEQCNGIKGVGWDFEKDMEFITRLLEIQRDIINLRETENQEQFWEGTIWSYDSAREEVKMLYGKYSDNNENQKFVDEICEQDLLTKEQCEDIKGEGGFLDFEENMGFVRNLLIKEWVKTTEGNIKVE